MSRMPPVPPAARPVHGPEGVPKTSVDVSHRVRQGAEKRGDPEPVLERGPGSASPAASSLPALLIAGFFGYALGLLTLRP